MESTIKDSVLLGVVQRLNSSETVPPGGGMSSSGVDHGGDDYYDDIDIIIRSRFQHLLLRHYQDDEEKDIGGRTNEGGDGGDGNYKTMAASTSAPSPAVEDIGTFWKNVVDLCLHIVHHQTTETTTTTSSPNRYGNFEPRKLPFALVSDALDVISSQDDMEQFWTLYLEPELDHLLLDESIFTKETRFMFLKFCNQLLHSIDRTTTRSSSSSSCSTDNNNQWKGRVLLALSKGFSIGDASGRQMYHHNHNIHSSSSAAAAANGMSVDENDHEENNGDGDGLNSAFRGFLSSLRTAFTDNSNNNNNEGKVLDIIQKSRRVLEAFESAGTSPHRSPLSMEIGSTYRSSSSVLHAQVNDPVFRSNVLAQFLIIASHLSFESIKAKNMLDRSIKRACRLLLRDNRELHDELWSSILANREVSWCRWKKDSKSNPSAFLPSISSKEQQKLLDQTDEHKKLLESSSSSKGRQIDNNKRQNEEDAGGGEDLTRIGTELRERTPTLEDHLQPYVDALDPENGIEDAYHPKNDSLYTWRANRLFAKHQLQRLSSCRGVADLERITRDFYHEKGIIIPEAEEEEEEEEEAAAVEDDDDDDDDDEKESNLKEAESTGVDEQADKPQLSDEIKADDGGDPTKTSSDEMVVISESTGDDKEDKKDHNKSDDDVVMKDEKMEQGSNPGEVEGTMDSSAGTSKVESSKEDDTNAPSADKKDEETTLSAKADSIQPHQPDGKSSPIPPPVAQRGRKRGRSNDVGGRGRGRGPGGPNVALDRRDGGGGPGFDNNDSRGHHRGGPEMFRGGGGGGGGRGGGFDGRHHGRGRGRGGRGRGRGRGGRHK